MANFLTAAHAQRVLRAKSEDIHRDCHLYVGSNYGGDIKEARGHDDGFPHGGFFDTLDKLTIFPKHFDESFDVDTESFAWNRDGYEFSSYDDAVKCLKWMWDLACMLQKLNIETLLVSVRGSEKGYVDWATFIPTGDIEEDLKTRYELESNEFALWVYISDDDLEEIIQKLAQDE